MRRSDASKISRVSTGLGYSNVAALNYGTGGASLVFESTFEKAIENNQNADLKNHGCPPRRCDRRSRPETCNTFHVERYPDTYLYKTSTPNAFLERIQDTLTPLSYNYAAAQFGSTLAYARNCETRITPFDKDAYNTNSTCFFVNQTEPFGNNQGYAVYYDALSIGPEKRSNRTRIVFQKVRFPSDLPDQYVFPLDNVDIYDGVLSDDGQTITDVYSNRMCDSDYSTYMLWPQVFQPMREPETLYTAIDFLGQRSIKTCYNQGFKSEKLSTQFYSAYFASPRSDHKQLTFVGQLEDDSEIYLYVADLIRNFRTTFDSKPLTVVNRDVNEDVKLLSYIELDGVLGRVRLRKHSSDVYFEQNLHATLKCLQLYHVNAALNDFSSPRLLSTGLGSVDGFDIFTEDGEDKVVYAGDFMKRPKDATKEHVHKCYPVGCDDPQADATLQQFCTGKTTKYLGSSFDIYIVNTYGNIEQRVTNNNAYEGEVFVDQKRRRIYYSKESIGRIDIAYRSLDNLDEEVIVTKNLAAGYYGGATVTEDNKLVYHAYKPTGEALTNFSNILFSYHVVDTTHLEIYYYDMDRELELQVTRFGARSLNPTTTPYLTVFFETNSGSADPTKYSMQQIYLDEDVSDTILNSNPANPHSISFASESIVGLCIRC
ncbi:hypothetical protein M3Y97_01135200 [Aphelenchoides bicaudatus]|nr:hypothetical protein M3Y97_01135200 [Aphelenchoides bicaudatus]